MSVTISDRAENVVKILKILGALAGAVLLLVVVVLIGARFADGPLEIIAGGPFSSGELHTGPEPDWAFVADIPTVEFQLLDPARSRTTWIVEHEGKIYIPSGYMTTWWGKIWKQWPLEVAQDGRAILRVNGTLFDRQLIRVTEGPELVPIVRKLGVKYMGMTPEEADRAPPEQLLEPVTSGYLWIFELAPR